MSPLFSTKPGDDPVKNAYDSLQRLLGCEAIKQKGRKPSPVTVIQKIFACLGQNLGSTTPHSKLQSLLSSVRTQFIPYLKSINGSGSSPKSASRKSINSSAKDVLFEEFHSWLDKLVYGSDTDLTASAHHKTIRNNSFSWTQIAEEAFEFLLEAVDESLFDKSQVGSKFIPLLIDLLCDKKVSTVVKRNAIGVVIMLISKPNNKENRDTILNDPHMLPRLLSILFDCRDVDLQFLTLEILFRLTPKEGHARDTLISKLSAYFANRPHPPSLKEKCSPNKQRLRLQDAFTEYLQSVS
ncbi:hypothetical protein BKA69DRAFT_442958 [Paraphysoderma sedebokerense]|nr:hypothetical protein BKA69DRAFT_442958 [Paraphysoderma sedebokerense]